MRSGVTRNASSGTCTARTPTWPRLNRIKPGISAERSTCPVHWPTWSPTTAGDRSPASPEAVRRQTGHDVAEQARILVVSGKRQVADGMVELVCEQGDGDALPRWAPGAHVDLVLGPALARPYSLYGDPDDNRRW